MLEEIICDAQAQMNAFATEQTERITGEVGVFLRSVGRSAKAGKTAAMKNTTGNGGGKHSLETQKIPTWEELEAKLPIKVVDISKAETSGSFAERRAQIKNRMGEIIKRPYLNRDTGALIFITPKSYTHSFNNLGDIQLNAAEHLPELIENAVLTHAEPITHGNEYAVRMYTFFAAGWNGRVIPVKLKVKEYAYSGQEIPRNIESYFENSPKDYAALYDTVVLEIEEIEEGPSGSVKDMNQNDSFLDPGRPSTTKIPDLLNLVNIFITVF